MDIKDPFTIIVHHVGGFGEAGPTEVFRKLGNVEWIVYDALDDAVASSQLESNYHAIKAAVGESDSEANFYTTKSHDASSLLLPAESAKNYTFLIDNGFERVWGIHTEVESKETMKTTSLDSLIENKKAPQIDFLSVDAQGAELSILNGASKELANNVLGVFIEAEFSRLYENQPLFCDTQARLVKDNFRLCDILNVQYFNVAPYSPEVFGAGFMTVCEPLYLKEFSSLKLDDVIDSKSLSKTVIQALKLAAISIALDRLDYALLICRSLEKRGLSLDVVAETYDVKYLNLLRDFVKAAKIVDERSPPSINFRDTKLPSRVNVLALSPQTQVPLISDEITDVLYNYDFKELSIKHTQRVSLYRVGAIYFLQKIDRDHS